MEIRAGGRRWLVEAHETRGATPSVPSWEVSFHSPDGGGDRVDMRWIPRPERLTESLARTLFELAGERLWRDGRSGVIYRIHLVDEGRPGDDSDPAAGRLLVQFRAGSAAGSVPWELDRPLGLATDDELAELADRVQPHLRGMVA